MASKTVLEDWRVRLGWVSQRVHLTSMQIELLEFQYKETLLKKEEELKEAIISTCLDAGLNADFFKDMAGDYTAEEFGEKLKAKATEYYNNKYLKK